MGLILILVVLGLAYALLHGSGKANEEQWHEEHEDHAEHAWVDNHADPGVVVVAAVIILGGFLLAAHVG
jgi:hypothetical protein